MSKTVIFMPFCFLIMTFMIPREILECHYEHVKGIKTKLLLHGLIPSVKKGRKRPENLHFYFNFLFSHIIVSSFCSVPAIHELNFKFDEFFFFFFFDFIFSAVLHVQQKNFSLCLRLATHKKI